jgi:TPP-dependent pyruvate/acetoin dehydrogenase alpha subunit
MTEPASSPPDRLEWYQTMVRIRLFEEKVRSCS